MFVISAKSIKLLVFVLLIVSSASVFGADWPVKSSIDLSNGFGDFRHNRFHTGIDIRTGGKEGISIYSPVSGYIYRIRASYEGYGKGLYVMGDDGYLYVYAHLKDFNGDVDKLLKEAQIASERYYQDIYLPKDSLKVKKGAFLGYTGQTGAGAPHLHFEKRTADNYPLNPLKHGFELNDKVKPTFTSLGFKQRDDFSLFENGRRELQYDVVYNSNSGEYELDTLLYFSSPFSIYTGVFDKMRKGGMKQPVYKLTLTIDDKLYYKIVFDTLDFDNQRSVNFEYEYLNAVSGDKRVYRLYNEYGNMYRGSKSENGSKGVFGEDGHQTIGHHTGVITAEDCFGNKSILRFNFIWGPKIIYTLDSTSFEKPKNNYFYFTPLPGYENLKIDSVVPFINRGEMWGKAKGTEVIQLENGQIRCRLVGLKTTSTTTRLFVFSKDAVIRDNLFNGIFEKGKASVKLSYEIVDDGLLAFLNVESRISSESRLELYYKDTLLGVEYPTFFNMNKYICFIPPSKKYKRIDKIGYAMSRDTVYQAAYLDSLNIHVVGLEDNQNITVNRMTFEFHKKNFYTPRFIEIKEKFYLKYQGVRFASKLLEVFPKAFICKEDFSMVYSLPTGNPFNEKSGICWYDEDEQEWIWLDNTLEGQELRSTSTGGGVFAVVYDLLPPTIELVSIKDGRTYSNFSPNINFILKDSISGIEDDQSILVRLNNQWMIPEYDIESNRFRTKPLAPLSPGKQHLGIEVVDRAGNVTEQYLNFFIKKK